jgi:threonylcarbamoyladenosine tRNA methylthiotransferase MtaB
MSTLNAGGNNNSKVVNFGCRNNIYESEVMQTLLCEHDIKNVLIFNTCAVTKEAERQSRQAIRKAKRQNPDKKIIVTGCASQINFQAYNKMPEVDAIIDNAEKNTPDAFKKLASDIQSNTLQKQAISDIMQVKHEPKHDVKIVSFEGRTRGFIQIQNGCNHRCTFCIIPFGRGNSRCVSPKHIIADVEALVNAGYCEVVLTGVDITDYGSDLPDNFNLGKLCKQILTQVPNLPRLRLSSIDVAEIDSDLLDLICYEPRFMPYLHISLQSGDNLILKRMKRRHNREMVLEFCAKIRKFRPQVTFGSDIIAGFPTETDAMFMQTKDLLLEAGIIFNHIFSYSPRDGTPAARMPQVDHAIKKERTKALIEQTKAQQSQYFASQVGLKHSVLVELDKIGRAENFIPIYLDLPDNYVNFGKIAQVEVVKFENSKLFGKIID